MESISFTTIVDACKDSQGRRLDYINVFSSSIFRNLFDEPHKSVAIFEFNKSLDYKGGILDKSTTQLIRQDMIRFKVKQDLDDDTTACPAKTK